MFSENDDNVLKKNTRHRAYPPLPPYIKRKPDKEDDTKYQTVYAQDTGFVAAPTAGLHFTEELLKNIQAKGIKKALLMLHIGYETFVPIRTEDVGVHKMDAEYFEILSLKIDVIKNTKQNGNRIIATCTTACRILEEIALKIINIFQKQ